MEFEREHLSLIDTIISLISLKQEGAYWDFKREWYEKKADMLHDIICMANNPDVNRDSYIIIGVDEENDYCVNDVKQKTTRYNTQNLVDFLKSKSFAGDYRPFVTVETLELYDGTIDVIVVHNSNNTPFFLSKDYKDEDIQKEGKKAKKGKTVYANHIYARVGDTNTPIDQSADYNIVEKLWKKRLGLVHNMSILERMKQYLFQLGDWDYSAFKGNMTRFYRFAPEYKVQIIEDQTRTGFEFYMINSTKPHPDWFLASLYYHQTVLDEELCILIDKGNCYIVAPHIGSIPTTSCCMHYAYYEKDSIAYALHGFLRLFDDELNENVCVLNTFMRAVLVFNTRKERIEFEDYMKNKGMDFTEKYKEVEKTEVIDLPDLKGYNLDDYRKKYLSSVTLNLLFDQYKQNKQ